MALDHRQITLFAIFNEATKIREQSNTEISLEESVSPAGVPWTWTLTDPFGDLSVLPTFSFAYDNADHTQVRLSWSGIDDGDWLSLKNARLTLTLTSGAESIIYESGGANGEFLLSLRRVAKAGFYVLENRDSCDGVLPATDVDTYSFDVLGDNFASTGGDDLPENFYLLLGGNGAVNGFGGDTSPAWNEEATFALSIRHGVRPPCLINDFELQLKDDNISKEGYLLLKGFNSTEDAVSVTDTGSYVFSASNFIESIGSLPTNFDMQFNSKGAVIGVSGTTDPIYDVTATFDLCMSKGQLAGSIFNSRDLLLRPGSSLDGYLLLEHFDSTGSALGVTDTNSWDFSVSGAFTNSNGTALPGDFELTFDDKGSIVGVSGTSPTWDSVSTFTLKAKHPTEPNWAGSLFETIDLCLRPGSSLDGYLVIDGITTTKDALAATDTNTWDFSVNGDFTLISGTTLPGDFDLTFSNKGAIIGTTGTAVAWDQDATFTLAAKNASEINWAGSMFSGINILLRKLSPDPVIVFESGAADNIDVTVLGDADPFNWTDFNCAAFANIDGPDSLGTNKVALTWDAGDLTAYMGSSTTFVLKVQKGSYAWCLVAHDISCVSGIDVRVTGASSGQDHNLHGVREKMRYEQELFTNVNVQGDEYLDWEIDPAVNSVLELEALDPTDAKKRVLQTITDSTPTVVVKTIPSDWGPASKIDPPVNHTIQVKVTRKKTADDAIVDGGNWVDLTLPVSATGDDIDVAILLDRSGSMRWGGRWEAAVEGAEIFSVLVSNTPSAATQNVGVYWFNGNCGDRTHDHTLYPEGAYCGTFNAIGGGTLSLDSDNAINGADDVANGCNTLSPMGCTGIGAGLVHCKQQLKDFLPAEPDREKVIMCLSDGMENCNPKLETIFPAPDGVSTYWNGEADGVRIYSVAVLTNHSWVTTLKAAADRTGGLGALDVKHIMSGTGEAETNDMIQKWFIGSFKKLFSFDEPDSIPDPEIDGGDVHHHPITVNMDTNKIIFYMLMDGDDKKWDFGVIPPGQSKAIYHGLADNYDGVHAFGGKFYQMLVIDLPLGVAGHGHRWAGEWKIVVCRDKGAGTKNYSIGALTNQGDLNSSLTINVPKNPLPGDKAELELRLVSENGSPIKNANVTAVIHIPGEWPGHLLAHEVGSNIRLVKQLAGSKSMANMDTDNVWDRVFGDLSARGAIKPGPDNIIQLRHHKKGVYKATIALTRSGDYNIDVSVVGKQKFKKTLIDMKLSKEVTKLPEYYRNARELKREREFIRQNAGTDQKLKLEFREQITVSFKPTVKDSETGGYFKDGKTIRLLVQPAGKDNVLLGPGYAESIEFIVPGNFKYTWPAIDRGDGDYYVDVPFTVLNPVLDHRAPAIVADAITLEHPMEGGISPYGNKLPLEGFSVKVLGVELPLTVWSLIGNSKSKQAHLMTCEHVAKMSNKNKVWLHNLKHAKQIGYDTCEWCLPLICNTDKQHMEAHKIFCSRVRFIKQKNRIEIHTWRQAESLGFDGCHWCLPDKHSK